MSVVIIIQDTLHPSSFVCKRMKFWFRRHGLDYEKFKSEGISIDELRATGDQVDKINALEKTAIARISRSNGK